MWWDSVLEFCAVASPGLEEVDSLVLPEQLNRPELTYRNEVLWVPAAG